MIDNRILEAEQGIVSSPNSCADKHQYAMAINKAYRAVVAGAKAILVTEGIDPNTDADTLLEFDNMIQDQRALLPAEYHNVADKIWRPRDQGRLCKTLLKAKLIFPKGLSTFAERSRNKLGRT